MPDLSRVIGAFAKTPLYSWDGSTWVDTGTNWRIQVFDRFITERAFGQKKRIATTPGEVSVDPALVYRFGDSELRYLMENAVPDIEGSTQYATVATFRVASTQVRIERNLTTTSQSGVKIRDGVEVVATTFADIGRYTDVNSKAFDSVSYSIFDVVLPAGCPITTDCRVVVVGTGEVLAVDEVFTVLELTGARCTSHGNQ